MALSARGSASAERLWRSGLGLGQAAVQVIPFFDFLFRSTALTARAAPVVPFSLGETALRLVILVVPNFSGTPINQNYRVPSWTSFNDQTGYIGLLATGLAVVGQGRLWASATSALAHQRLCGLER